MTDLSVDEIRAIRVNSLLLANSDIDSVLGVTRWFGAMQAQDLASGKWSYGARIAGLTEHDVDEAIEDAQVLRTWPMRGTIHFVPATDVRWMLELTGVRTLAGAAKRREYLDLKLPEIERAGEIVGSALAGRKRLSRPAVLQTISDGGVNIDGQRGYHVLWYLSQIGLTCIGPQEGKQQTFVLLADWAPKQRELSREQALAELALRYFRSHGPAPHQDFTGWAGITATDAKLGIAECGAALAPEMFEGRQFWMAAGARDQPLGSGERIHALPGFDEFVLGFKDRGLIYDPKFANEIIPGGNGMFRSTIVDGGKAIGTWTRTIKKARAEVTAIPFGALSRAQTGGFTQAIGRYGAYLGIPVEIVT